MKMKKIYKILLLIAVCIIAVSGCKKEDKDLLYRLRGSFTG